MDRYNASLNNAPGTPEERERPITIHHPQGHNLTLNAAEAITLARALLYLAGQPVPSRFPS